MLLYITFCLFITISDKNRVCIFITPAFVLDDICSLHPLHAFVILFSSLCQCLIVTRLSSIFLTLPTNPTLLVTHKFLIVVSFFMLLIVNGLGTIKFNDGFSLLMTCAHTSSNHLGSLPLLIFPKLCASLFMLQILYILHPIIVLYILLCVYSCLF